MKKLRWENIRLIAILLLAAGLFSFGGHRNANRPVEKINVVLEPHENPMLSAEAVNKLLIEKNSAITGIGKEKLDLNRLEKTVNSHGLVEASQVYVSVDGVLKAVVRQKTPVVRVFESKGSFYIDPKGGKMPLSDLLTARVPLLTGDFKRLPAAEFTQVLQFIHADEFLSKNIIGIEVKPSGNLIMRNRNFDYEIEFGGLNEAERKFENYKAFFQKASQDSTIGLYKKINLRFTQQVVCTK